MQKAITKTNGQQYDGVDSAIEVELLEEFENATLTISQVRKEKLWEILEKFWFFID